MSSLIDIGWVYILSHKKHDDLKIGFTTRTVKQRIKDLESSTGVMPGFVCEYAVKCNFPRKVEQIVHEMLSAYRVSKNREFFSIDLESAAGSLHDACNLSNDVVLEVYDLKELQKIAETKAELAMEQRRVKEKADREFFERAREYKLKKEEENRTRKIMNDRYEFLSIVEPLKYNCEKFISNLKWSYRIAHLILGWSVVVFIIETFQKSTEYKDTQAWVLLALIGYFITWIMVEYRKEHARIKHNNKVDELALKYKIEEVDKFKLS